MKFNWIKQVLGVAAVCAAAAVGAQSYPTKPIKIYVPILAGGAPDIAARVLGQALSEEFKQPVVVDNRPGSNGNIAADLTAKSAPDGYTLLLAADSGIVINPHVYAKLPFNPLTDLIPIATVAANQFVLTINPNLPPKTFKEFIEYARKANPPLYYASGGNGGQHHLIMELLKQRSGVNMVHVPYKSGSAATTAVVGGEVAAMFAGSSNASQIKAGKLRAIAVTSATRAPDYPDLPAIAEFYPGFEAKIWLGLFAPAGTPPEIVERLRVEVQKALRTPAVQQRLAGAGGMEVLSTTPKEFHDLIQRDNAKYSKLVKELNLKID